MEPPLPQRQRLFALCRSGKKWPEVAAFFWQVIRRPHICGNWEGVGNAVRDEPGTGGVRIGATRSDLYCRVVATSRRVAPTQSATVDSPFLAAARRVASDSSTPGRHARRQWYSTRRAARLVCRDLSPRQSPTRPTYVAREGWPDSSDSSDSVGLCRTKMSRDT